MPCSNSRASRSPSWTIKTHLHYVLVPLNVYQRVRSIFADESFDVTDTYGAQSAAAGAAGWDDPEMDVYDQYDAHRKTP